MEACKSKRLIALLALIAALVLAVPVWAETLYVQRTRVDIKKGQGAFFPTIYTAGKGEALQVTAQQNGWYKVRTPRGEGWVFSQALAASKPGASLAGFFGTSSSSELDKSAGFKGFDAPTERAYVSGNRLQAQIRQVDRIEQPDFTVNELRTFQQQGRVGIFGGAR